MAISLKGLSALKTLTILKTAFVDFVIEDNELFGVRYDESRKKVLSSDDLSGSGPIGEIDGGELE